jgi:chemotaxis protein MotB
MARAIEMLLLAVSLTVLAAGPAGAADQAPTAQAGPAPAPPPATSTAGSTTGAAKAPAATTSGAAGAPSFDEVEALVKKMQDQLARMNDAEAKRNQSLQYLQKQVDAATNQLKTKTETAASLEAKTSELGSTVETLQQDRQQLSTKLQSVQDERDTRIKELEQKLASLDATLSGSEAKARTAATSLASTQDALQASQARAGQLEQQSRDQAAKLQATAGQVQRLTDLLTKATTQLQAVSAVLDTTSTQVRNQQVTIADLGQKLNQALARKVEELQQYRSEFFGRLKQILGSRDDIRIVGDRFVFQSEVLFGSGSADIGEQGQEKLSELADTLKQVAADIPSDIQWVLQVDGYTDKVPVRTNSYFASNWDLSTARAVAVVKFLIGQGIPPDRLAAAGFGEYHPLDPGDTPAAYQRNRRIEFKLTQG